MPLHKTQPHLGNEAAAAAAKGGKGDIQETARRVGEVHERAFVLAVAGVGEVHKRAAVLVLRLRWPLQAAGWGGRQTARLTCRARLLLGIGGT